MEKNDLSRNREGKLSFGKHMPRFVLLDAENIEKEKLGASIKSPFTKKEVQQLVIAFLDENDFISYGEKVFEKMTDILHHCTRLYEATAGRV